MEYFLLRRESQVLELIILKLFKINLEIRIYKVSELLNFLHPFT